MSPVIHRDGGLRFFVWSWEPPHEPAHIHVASGDARAKWWLEPLSECYSNGFSPAQRSRIRAILREHHTEMVRAWYAQFPKEV
jgi:hypothetical protein